MNNVDVDFILPNELKHMSVINTISSPILDIKILILGENLKHSKRKLPTIRIYRLKKGLLKYEVDKELEAFSFKDTPSAMEFVMNLPRMSALEILNMMDGMCSHDTHTQNTNEVSYH